MLPPALIFPVFLSTQVLLPGTRLRLLICVTEAAMPPGRPAHDSRSARALAAAAARIVVRRHFPHQAPSSVIPLPTIITQSVPTVSDEQTLWQDSGVTAWLLNETATESVA